MSGENKQEEIDLGQLLGYIKSFFIRILKLIISVILFYKKKWVLFSILFIAGGVLGYVLDKYFSEDVYEQEIIITPNYESILYVYDFIEDFNTSFQEENFRKDFKITENQVENFIGLAIEPVISQTDVLDYFKNVYGEKNAHHVIGEMDLQELEDEKYRKFFQFHRITFYFKGNDESYKSLSKTILNIVKGNPYFKEIIDFELQKTKENLTENKKTLDFIDGYLDKINNGSKQKNREDQNLIIYSNESETPTISSLIDQKNLLINRINSDERKLVLNENIFKVLEYKQILLKEKGLRDRKTLLIPMILVVGVSLLFLFNFLWKKINSFI